MEENTDYPLTPFLDFAEKLDYEIDPPTNGWGLMKPERREDPVPSHGAYLGVGIDNPYLDGVDGSS